MIFVNGLSECSISICIVLYLYLYCNYFHLCSGKEKKLAFPRSHIAPLTNHLHVKWLRNHKHKSHISSRGQRRSNCCTIRAKGLYKCNRTVFRLFLQFNIFKTWNCAIISLRSYFYLIWALNVFIFFYLTLILVRLFSDINILTLMKVNTTMSTF